jgi:uncharacterized membrane protein
MREIMLIIHFIGLAMGLGTSIGYIFLAAAGSKMEKTEQQKFMFNSFSLSRMGQTGLVLLIISGGYLMTPYWSLLSSMPLLIAKLSLVLLLTILIIIVNSMMVKAKKGEAEKYLAKIPVLGRISLLIVLTIVVLAVYIFH